MTNVRAWQVEKNIPGTDITIEVVYFEHKGIIKLSALLGPYTLFTAEGLEELETLNHWLGTDF